MAILNFWSPPNIISVIYFGKLIVCQKLGFGIAIGWMKSGREEYPKKKPFSDQELRFLSIFFLNPLIPISNPRNRLRSQDTKGIFFIPSSNGSKGKTPKPSLKPIGGSLTGKKKYHYF